MIVREKNVKATGKLPIKRKNMEREKLKIASIKNHFLPARSSSLANHEIKYPTGIARRRIIISDNILFLGFFVI